jgi:hypothetical protein
LPAAGAGVRAATRNEPPNDVKTGGIAVVLSRR